MLALNASRYPGIVDNDQARGWLTLLSNLGRADATVDAYARGLSQYLAFCQMQGIEAEHASLEHVSQFVRWLRGDDCGHRREPVANSTLHQRLTAVRLWYDHLVYQQVRKCNPVPRGHYLNQHQDVSRHQGFARGFIPRLIKLPAIPTDAHWHQIIAQVVKEPLRNRLMFALAYYGALRRQELVGLHVTDIDVAHRLITVRSEISKNGCGRVVCYGPAAGQALVGYLSERRLLNEQPGPLFLSTSNRNRGQPLSQWQWSKTVERMADQAGVPGFSTHSLRHLRLTHLARAGWALHEISTYAGHRNPRTTLTYLHLSGRDLAAKMATSIQHQDQQFGTALFSDER